MVGGLLLMPIATATEAMASKPNIVLIVADDLGYNELGCYGQTKIKTPHLDRLATQGMRFTQHYSGNAVCAPSRCVLMTAKHPGHAYVRANKGTPPEGQEPIPKSEATLAEVIHFINARTLTGSSPSPRSQLMSNLGRRSDRFRRSLDASYLMVCWAAGVVVNLSTMNLSPKSLWLFKLESLGCIPLSS